jgi:hypothetical protein
MHRDDPFSGVWPHENPTFAGEFARLDANFVAFFVLGHSI